MTSCSHRAGQTHLRRYGAVILLLTGLTAVSFGQKVIEVLPRWLFSTHFEIMFPQSPVNRFLYGADAGYRMELQYRLQHNMPYLAGVYYSEAGLSRYVLRYTYTDPDGSQTNIRERARTLRMDVGLTAGFYPEINWWLQPYVQGKVGLAVFKTASILVDRSDGEEIDRIQELSGTVPGYGLDLGVQIVPNIWFIRGDIRVGFVANPSVAFMALDKENAGTTGYPIEYFKQHTSAGSWVKVSVGIHVLIGNWE